MNLNNNLTLLRPHHLLGFTTTISTLQQYLHNIRWIKRFRSSWYGEPTEVARLNWSLTHFAPLKNYHLMTSRTAAGFCVIACSRHLYPLRTGAWLSPISPSFEWSFRTTAVNTIAGIWTVALSVITSADSCIFQQYCQPSLLLTIQAVRTSTIPRLISRQY